MDDTEVVVRMGWAFQARIPRNRLVRAWVGSDAWFFGIGVHTNLRGRWVVNGSPDRIVSLEVDPPAPGRALGVPVRVRRLDVSLEDPQGFLNALKAPHLPR